MRRAVLVCIVVVTEDSVLLHGSSVQRKILVQETSLVFRILELALQQIFRSNKTFCKLFFFFFLFIPSRKIMKVPVLLVCVNPARAIKADTLKRLVMQRCSAKGIGNNWKKSLNTVDLQKCLQVFFCECQSKGPPYLVVNTLFKSSVL